MKFSQEQKAHIRNLIKRYQRFIDATSVCRYCGSACEMCYRRAMNKYRSYSISLPKDFDYSGIKLSAGQGGSGGGIVK